MSDTDQSRNRGQWIPWIFFLLLLIGASILHTGVPSAIGYGYILLLYAGGLTVFFHQGIETIRAQRFYVGLFLVFSIIALLTTTLSPSLASGMRLIALLFFTAINLFILPNIIPFRHFLAGLGRFGAVMVVIGFVPFTGLSTDLLFIDLSLWDGYLYWLPSLSPITGIYSNPNALGILASVGIMAATGGWLAYDQSSAKWAAAINAVGLAFTNYRTGMVAVIMFFSLLAIFRLFGPNAFKLSIVGSILAFVVGLLMLLGKPPEPFGLADISLNNREVLWTAGWDAFIQNPIRGYGLGQSTPAIEPHLSGTGLHNAVHNSYLRMFLEVGIVGGIVYLAMVLGALVESAKASQTLSAGILASVLASMALIQVFNDLTFVGVSLPSAVIALSMGYYITSPEGQRSGHNSI